MIDIKWKKKINIVTKRKFIFIRSTKKIGLFKETHGLYIYFRSSSIMLNHNSKEDLMSEKVIFGRTENHVFFIRIDDLYYYSNLRISKHIYIYIFLCMSFWREKLTEICNKLQRNDTLFFTVDEGWKICEMILTFHMMYEFLFEKCDFVKSNIMIHDVESDIWSVHIMRLVLHHSI